MDNKITPLEGEFLEFNFYYTDIPEKQAFSQLFETLIELGAEHSGIGYAHKGKNIDREKFTGTTDLQQVEIAFDTDDLYKIMDDPDARLVGIYLKGGFVKGRNNESMLLTYLPISGQAMAVDRHPIAIWTEDGGIFDLVTYAPEYTEEARQIGQSAYAFFKSIVNRTKPAYAAITVEVGLECPTDLGHDPRSQAFRDFYVSSTFLSDSNTNRIKTLYAGAYLEEMQEGIYVSCWKWFNPEGIQMQFENEIEVSNIIASAGVQNLKNRGS